MNLSDEGFFAFMPFIRQALFHIHLNIKEKEAGRMRFTVNEISGPAPISEWFKSRLISYVKEKYGVELKVSVNEKFKLDSQIVPAASE